MIKKISIRHFLIILTVSLIILRFFEISETLSLLFQFIRLGIKRENFFATQLTFELVEQFVSSIGIFALLTVLLRIKRRSHFLNSPLAIYKCVILVICFLFVFSPIISVYNPNLQFNLSVAKMLSPFSAKVLVEIEEDESNSNDHFKKYYGLKKNLLRDVTDDKYFICDSVKMNRTIKIFQKGKEFEISNLSGNKISINNILFLFGTDEYGRDIFSRIIYATRLSTLIGICAVIVTLLIGGLLGFIAGYFSRNIDVVLNRFTEMLLAFPTIFLVILFLAYFGNSLLNVIIILGISGWKILFKIVRGEVIALKHKNFIITSQSIGMTKLHLLRKDFIPFLLPSIIVNLVFQFANVIIAESSLSYLGLTGNHFYPTLGAMILEGQFYLKQSWWIVTVPSFFLVITLLSIHSLGKKLQLKINPFIKE